MNSALKKNEEEEIREMIAIMRVIPKPSRAILLANANAFKVLEEVKKGDEALVSSNSPLEQNYLVGVAEGLALAREMDRETAEGRH